MMNDAIDGNGPLRFMDATVVREDLVFIVSQVEALNARGVDHTKVLRWKDGVWAHYMLDWPAIAVEHVKGDALSVLCLGLYGEVHVASGSTKGVEFVDESRERPANRGPLRDMRVIGEIVHVAGMQRQAYCRLGSSDWRRIDQGAVLPLNSTNIVSFDSIDGFDALRLYAVGLDGAIWRRVGDVWTELESPTSAGLEKVLCVKDSVFAAGQMGTLLQGRDDQWSVLDTEGLKDTIWDLCWFRENLYASTSKGLYRWTGARFEAVDTGLGAGWSYGSLAGNQDVLWSIGRTRLAKTTDGVIWVDVTCTDGSY